MIAQIVRNDLSGAHVGPTEFHSFQPRAFSVSLSCPCSDDALTQVHWLVSSRSVLFEKQAIPIAFQANPESIHSLE